MARNRRYPALILGGALLLGGLALPVGASPGELLVVCDGDQPSVGYDGGNGATPLSMPILTGELVPYDQAGAAVTVEFEFREGQSPDRVYILTVTYEGVKRRLTTFPHESGGHYPDRSDQEGQTEAGFVDVVTQSDGTYLSLQQSSSGSAGWWVWRLGSSCDGAPATTTTTTAPAAAPGEAPGAEAVQGTATFTG